MTQISSAEQNCFNHIDQWLNDGNTLDNLSAGKLHQLSGEFYTICIRAIERYQKEKAPQHLQTDMPAEFSELFNSFQQKVWQHFCENLTSGPATDHSRQNNQEPQVAYWKQLADERLDVITALEQRISEQRAQASSSEIEQRGQTLQQEETNRIILELEEKLTDKQAQCKLAEERLVEKEEQLHRLESNLNNEQKQAERKLADMKKQIAQLETSLSEATGSRQEFDQKIRELHMDSDQLKHQVSILEQELNRERKNHAMAQELSSEQAKEITELSRKLDLAEQEYIRVNNLYQEIKKQS